MAKPLILQAIADAGMKIDDLDEWKLEVGKNDFAFRQSDDLGFAGSMAVIESPTTADSTADEVKSQSTEKTLSAEAKASQDHYRTVVGMFDDLKKDMGSVANMASTQDLFRQICQADRAVADLERRSGVARL